MHQSRATVVGRRWAVATSHQLASLAGGHVLMHGGNFVDAAVAASAALSVCQNNLCGLGGDLFALIKIAGRRVEGLNGSGRAAGRATIDLFESKHLGEIPSRGPLAAITVPGIVRAWRDLLSRYGSMELKELLSPSIELAASGVALTANYARSISASARALGAFKGWADLFLPGGSAPAAGSVFRQKDLAHTLRSIAEDGADSFYDGELAEKISKGVERAGGLISSDDLRRHSSTWDEPLRTNYRGVDVYETAPNSQAATVLLWLNMLEAFDFSKYKEAELAESVMIPTCLKAYAERAKCIADPEYFPLPRNFTSKEFAREVSDRPADGRSVLEASASTRDRGDTTYFAVADAEGNCASVIQSNYMGFGSGLVLEGTGFVLNNRGCYFSLDRRHHNSLLPGKRTFHTLCASIAELDGRTLFGLGSMGGDVQPQVHAQLMTRILDYGYDIQRAVDAPRWIIPGTIYERPKIVSFEGGTAPGLERIAGLAVEALRGFTSQAGHAQVVMLSKGGGIFGAADPRGDGAAIAL